MPPTTFDDGEVADPQGVLDGEPKNGVAHAADTDPLPEPTRSIRGRRGKRRGHNPQQASRDATARSQGLPDGVPAAPEDPDAREARNWWPRILQEEFTDQGFSPSDAVIHVIRVKAAGRPAENRRTIDMIPGDQVLGHVNQTPGEALVDRIIRVSHEDAQGPATYTLKAYNNNRAKTGWTGTSGTLELDAPHEIKARQRRLEEYQRAQWRQQDDRPYPEDMRNAFMPRLPSAPTIPAPPPGAPPANPMEAQMMQWMNMIMQEAMTAFREGRQPVMPQAPVIAPSIPKPEDEDAKMLKMSKMIAEALVVAGVVQPGSKSFLPAAPARKDLIDELYDLEEKRAKLSKVVVGMARREGMVMPNEVELPEVPAPQIVPAANEDDDLPEGAGVVEKMLHRLGNEFAKDPGKMIGEIMKSPFGGLVKDLLLKQGFGLPNAGTAPGAPGGFSPST